MHIVVLCAFLLAPPTMADSPSPTAALSADPGDNPLPACPDTPNCERVSRPYAAAPDSLFRAAQDAAAGMGPVKMDVSPGTRHMHAVFRVALLFKDDVDVAVTQAADDPDASVLHIRSASRVGYSDLGVNARRVERFVGAVHEALAATTPRSD